MKAIGLHAYAILPALARILQQQQQQKKTAATTMFIT